VFLSGQREAFRCSRCDHAVIRDGGLSVMARRHLKEHETIRRQVQAMDPWDPAWRVRIPYLDPSDVALLSGAGIDYERASREDREPMRPPPHVPPAVRHG